MSATKPKIAIVYYSKSGHSWRMAKRLALLLDAELFALQTRRYKVPFFGYLRAGFDSLRGAPAPLEKPLPDITDHDAVIICGPVWTAYPAVPLISYLQQETRLPAITGLLLTCGEDGPPEKAFAKAAEAHGRAFVAQAAISNKIENQPQADRTINTFADTLHAAICETG